MQETKRTFPTRARRVDDDGADFEAFVFESFRAAKGEHGFSKRLARGRDGAIDLIDHYSEPGSTTVAECKFVGSGKAADVTERWREVYRNLTKNLPPLSDDPVLRVNSPYRAWLDGDRPVVAYRFCVSAPMSNSELATLEKIIREDFAKLVALGVASLRPLASNGSAVRVLSWDWFVAELDEHPSLAFRWFGGLPVGIEAFSHEGPAEPTFRDFLKGGELPYFSRDQYEEAGVGAVERGEADLVAGLADGSSLSLLLSGPGGVGKTRLAWELASVLSADKGFEVYRLGRSANFSSVMELGGSYPRDASLLLVIDYAEAVRELAGIADAVTHLCTNTGHRVRLVATCRASSLNQVADDLAVLEPKLQELGSFRAGEEAYARWVALSILSLASFPNRDELERVCHGVPALAAFALYLSRYHPQRFDAQFGGLHSLDDFEKWANHRIAMLISGLGDRRRNERTLARVALALPVSKDRLEARLADQTPLLEALMLDRWIEASIDEYYAAHDVFADALAARWLFEASHAATQHAIELLEDAARHDELLPTLIALDRLASHPKFCEIEGDAVIDVLTARYPEQVKRSCGGWFSGSMLSVEQKLGLLHRSELISKTVKNPAFDVSLSHLAAQAGRRKLSCAVLGGATLSELLDPVCDRLQSSNITLRWAYAFDPARFRARAYAWMAAHPQTSSTDFLLVQMLKSGEPPSALLQPVQIWLEKHATARRASFLYRSWLKARGGVDVIEEALLAWVGIHAEESGASYVFGEWLDAGGDFEKIREALFRWVIKWRHSPDITYISKELCKKSDLPNEISVIIAQWCVSYSHEDSLSRLSTLISHSAEKMGSNGGIVLLDAADKVITRTLEKPTLLEQDRLGLWALCLTLFRSFNSNPDAVSRLAGRIFSSGVVFDRSLRALYLDYLHKFRREVAQMLLYCLRRRELDLNKDFQALQGFVDWFCLADPDEVPESALDRLDREFPSVLWHRNRPAHHRNATTPS